MNLSKNKKNVSNIMNHRVCRHKNKSSIHFCRYMCYKDLNKTIKYKVLLKQILVIFSSLILIS